MRAQQLSRRSRVAYAVASVAESLESRSLFSATEPTTPDLLPAFDSGIASDDDVTNLDNASPESVLQFMVGNTLPGATVRIYADGDLIGSAVATRSSTVVPTNGRRDLKDGRHEITADQEALGAPLGGRSPALELTIDTQGASMPGDLDEDFGVITAMPFRNYSQGHAVAVQADGKILVAGEASGWQYSDFSVTRYNTDGSLDASFGYRGRVVTPLGNDYDRGRAIAVQSDGRIVVAGVIHIDTRDCFGVVRYLPDGSLDREFGTNGVVTIDYNNTACANAVFIQPDGRIVLAGDVYGTLAMARLLPDGTMDGSFGTSGVTTIPFGPYSDEAYDIDMDSSGRLLISGEIDTKFAVTRVLANGTLDSTFGTAGVASAGKAYGTAFNLALLADGRILATGYTFISGGATDTTTVRFTADGAVDTTFGVNGLTVTSTAWYDGGRGIRVLPGGSILVSGFANPGIDAYKLAVLRYSADGVLDASFGVSGIARATIGSIDDPNQDQPQYPAAMAVQDDGRIVVTGYSYVSQGSGYATQTALARFNANGTLDTTFAAGGVSVGFHGTAYSSVSDAVRQPDGKLIVVGSGQRSGFLDVFLLRYNPDYTLDTTFGDGGQITADLSGSTDSASRALLQPDGKILLIARPGERTTSIMVLRYNADGTVDQSFGANGRAVATVGDWPIAQGAVLQPDGRIVVGGVTGLSPFITRFNTNGSLDTGFGVSGVLVGGTMAIPASIACLPSGQLLIGGYRGSYSSADFAVTRMNADGSLDNSFGTGGTRVIPIRSSGDEGNAMQVLADGRILLAGTSYGPTGYDLAVVRLLPNGDLDTTFGTNGKFITSIISADDRAVDMLLQPDGRIVLSVNLYTYTSGQPSDNQLALMRLDADGHLDPAFGAAGVSVCQIGQVGTNASYIEAQPDGSILAAGTVYGLPAIYRFYGGDFALEAASDTGLSATDGVTADNTPGFVVDAPSTWRVLVDGVLDGPAYNDGTSFVARPMANGPHTVELLGVDAAGNVSSRRITRRITIDTVAPSVLLAAIAGGAKQRSMVNTLSVTFDGRVVLTNGALEVLRLDGTPLADVMVNVTNPSQDGKNWILTFSGPAVVGGSLPDGVYQLVATAPGVFDVAGNVMTADYTQRFHRLFGDSDGNRIINSLDYARLKQAFGRAPTDPLFNSAFDYEGNGLINALDLARFRQRYGMSYSY